MTSHYSVVHPGLGICDLLRKPDVTFDGCGFFFFFWRMFIPGWVVGWPYQSKLYREVGDFRAQRQRRPESNHRRSNGGCEWCYLTK